jgi:2-keto-3-deoxy-L-rhamnonate aldolase RhmA
MAFGTLVHMSDPAIVELLAVAGFDWVSLTLEHSTVSAADIAAAVRAADVYGVTTMLHVQSPDDPRLLSLLHTGLGAMCLQNAQTRGELEELVGVTRFAPLGSRGAHTGVRGDSYGTIPYNEYIQSANEDFIVAVALEDRNGIKHAEQILTVPGLDLAFVGLQDLSHSLGVPEQLGHPKVMDALAEVVEICRRLNITLGLPGYAHSVTELYDLGARIVFTPGSEFNFIRRAFIDHVASVRAEARAAATAAAGRSD